MINKQDMKHLTLDLFPSTTPPVEFEPIIFILPTGRIKHGSYYSDIFYSNGEFFRANEVVYWATIPTQVELRTLGEG